MPGTSSTARREPAEHLFVELARAAGGAVVFALPMLMTMEMWQLGFAMPPLRLALLLLATVPLLIGLSRYSGLRPTRRLFDDLADALVTVLAATVAVTAMLAALGLLGPGMSVREAVGTVAIQLVPGAIGASLARRQLGGQGEQATDEPPGYLGEILVMGAGALFLGLNVAPTEEVALIAMRMSPWHQLALIAVSLATMHAFVYWLGFHGTEAPEVEGHPVGTFLRFTLVGYALVLALSLYMLWTFGRLDGLSPPEASAIAVVLAFPGSVGAATARLIL